MNIKKVDSKIADYLPLVVVLATLLGVWASYLNIRTYYANKKKAEQAAK